MMKKLFAVLLALLMLTGIACAEDNIATKTAVNKQTVESVTGVITFDVPTRWFVMTPELVESIVNNITDEQFAEAGMTEENIAYMSTAMQQIDLEKMDMVFTTTLTGNLNVTVQQVPGMSMAYMRVFKSVYDGQFSSQYIQLGISADDITYYDIEQIGDLEWYRMDAEFIGNEVSQFITVVGDGDLIMMTFTNISEPDALPVIESVKVI